MIYTPHVNFSILVVILFFLTAIVSAADPTTKEYLIRISEDLSAVLVNGSPKNNSDFLKETLQIGDESDIVRILELPAIPLERWYLVRIKVASPNQISVLRTNPEVEIIQENNQLLLHNQTVNDSLYAEQWYHQRVKAIESWKNFSINPDVIIAIIDTGIDYKHPDLEESLWINTDEDLNGNGRFDPEDQNNIDDDSNGYIDDVIGWDFTDAPRLGSGGDYTDPDNEPMDDFPGGHGTKIAGIIAARTNNHSGISGLIPGAKVMNLRAGTASGYLEEDDVARAVLYAINNGARIINMSFGDVVLSRFLKDVIEYAYSKDIVIVASAGNSGNDVIHYPSGLAGTISVGATDRNDERASFSNFGGTLDLVAPGVDILSTSPGGEYGMAGGTSFSAPMVSATVALLLSKNEGLSVEQVRNQLKTSTDDLGIKGWDFYFGSGRLQMEKASLLKDEGSLVFHHPLTGSHTSEDTIVIVVTAQNPDLISLELDYGIGTDPSEWIEVVAGYAYQIIDDTMAILPVKTISDTSLTLRLRLQTWDGEVSESRSIISIDRTGPRIANHNVVSLLDGSNHSYLLKFDTDDVCIADIFIRSLGEENNFSSVRLAYETRKHDYLFSPQGDIEYFVKVTNYSGLQSIDDNNGNYHHLKAIENDLFREEFVQSDYTIPAGYMLPEVTDFDQDGRFEIVISEYDINRNFGPVAVYELNDGQFVKQMETSFKAIPRSYGDADGDGRPELLLGYGQKSYLLESMAAESWSSQIVWSDTGAFWASRITDIDQDGKNEILGKEGNDFILYETTGDNTFLKKNTFLNQSSGSNQLGPPRAEVADLDNDGYLEVYFGDYDGDIIAYENTSNDTYESRGSIALSLQDATNFFSATTNNSQPIRSLIAGSHTNTNFNYEHEFGAQYWSYSVIRMTEENSYDIRQEIPVYGQADLRDFDAGCNIAALKDEGEDYVFLAPYPDLYVLKADGDSLVPVWHHEGVNTNAVLAYDFDQDGHSEFFFNIGDQIIAYTKNAVERPLRPGNLQANPLNQSSIYLSWQATPEAEKYLIYRGNKSDHLSKYDSTYSETYYMDTNVVEDISYFYAVRAVSVSFEQIFSNFTETVKAEPNAPPRVDTLLVKNERQVEVYFNENMDINAMPAVNFSLVGEENPTTSAISFYNGKAVLLSFSYPLQNGGVYDLKMTAIRDTNRTPLYVEDTVRTFVYQSEKIDKPYIREWHYEGKKHLVLKFNMPMKVGSIVDTDNYILEPSGSVVEIQPLGATTREFRLELSDDTYPVNSGITTYLILNGLQNARGEAIEEGKRIALIKTLQNIDDILVYPQPLTRDKEWLMFANLGAGTEIRIFDINGHFVVLLKEEDLNGGIRWDLKDDRGQRVSSGIFLYQATFDNQKKLGKFTVIR